MNSDAVVNSFRPGFAGRVIGCDNKGFVTCSAQMLEYPKNRVADTIDLGEEGFGDDRNAHVTTVSEPAVDKVSCGHTGHEICWSKR